MPNNMKKGLVWIIGAGYMAKEYSKVLSVLNLEFTVIGNSVESAKAFEQETGVKVITGGLKLWLQKTNECPFAVINAVSVPCLYNTTKSLLQHGIKRLLVEKPAGLNQAEICDITESADKNGAQVFVAYNRRFYASVLKAQEIIKQDNGVSSFNFEFTEWNHRLCNQNIDKAVAEQWLLCNSSHVVDMAFFMGGWPTKMTSFVAGSLDWHPSGSIFSGAGISDKNALFSYQANWASPGRWSVEILTPVHKLIFRPLEKLKVQQIGRVDWTETELDDSLDVEFKPGLYKQVEAFINEDYVHLLPIAEQAKHHNGTYLKIKSGGANPV